MQLEILQNILSNTDEQKVYLVQIYEELTKHIPKKHIRHRLCITNQKKSGNIGSITYKSKRISNANNKNKNKTCKNYNVSTNKNTTTIIKV